MILPQKTPTIFVAKFVSLIRLIKKIIIDILRRNKHFSIKINRKTLMSAFVVKFIRITLDYGDIKR
jgi:hypothetical protein